MSRTRHWPWSKCVTVVFYKIEKKEEIKINQNERKPVKENIKAAEDWIIIQ